MYMAGSNILFTMFGTEVNWGLQIDVWMSYERLSAWYVSDLSRVYPHSCPKAACNNVNKMMLSIMWDPPYRSFF